MLGAADPFIDLPHQTWHTTTCASPQFGTSFVMMDAMVGRSQTTKVRMGCCEARGSHAC